MTVEGISGWQPLNMTLLQTPVSSASLSEAARAAASATGVTGATGASGPTASGMLADFQSGLVEGLKSVNETQTSALQQMSDFLEGKGPALHTVMLSMEQANLSLEFAVQMRNKIMDAYTEIMRMQV